MDFDFSQTYLYKMHRLTTSLDAVFDTNLRKHADIGLSQFTLLLSVQQYQPTSQRQIVTFLDISPGAISRQVEIAQSKNWIVINGDVTDRRKQLLSLTATGEKKITAGLDALEKYVFNIFNDENKQTNLMHHMQLLQANIDSVIKNKSTDQQSVV
jgi:DNA-binding MarR family transcriptional regulator